MSTLINLLTKHKFIKIISLFIFLILILFLRQPQTSTTNNNIQPTISPQPSTTKLEITTYSPISTHASIANTRTAIVLTFSRRVTEKELSSLYITLNPKITYTRKVSSDYKNLYLTPNTNWENDQEYILKISSPHLNPEFSLYFTATTEINSQDIINQVEKIN